MDPDRDRDHGMKHQADSASDADVPTTSSPSPRIQDADSRPQLVSEKKKDLPAEPSPSSPLSNRTSASLSTTRAEEPAQVEAQPPFTIYSQTTKRLIVLFASLSAFFSPLTAQIYLPALPTLSHDFSVSSAEINLTVTTYMIFQGITPTIIGSLADSAGRRPAYIICFVIYIAANIGLALSPNYASLLAIRCLQSAGSSTTVALCQAVVADIITSAERGEYIGITAIPTVLAPSLGPVLGGVIVQFLGWRWIFWVLAIAAVVNLAVLVLWFPETCRVIVGNGSLEEERERGKVRAVHKTLWRLGREGLVRRRKRLERENRSLEAGQVGVARTESIVSRPEGVKSKIKGPNLLASLALLFEKELGVLLFYSGIVFAGFYATATAMPSQFTELYGLTDLQVGLMYLPMAGGSIIAALVVGPLMNKNYVRHANKLGMPVDKTREMDLSKFPIERARLELGLPLLVLTTCVTICWGWAVEYRAHLAVPCVLLFLQGLGIVGFINTVNALIVDIHPGKAGSAVAANNLTRCLLGAAASAAIVPMIDAWGAGGAFTFLGGLFVVFGPSMWLVMHYGIKWRGEYRDKEARKEEKKREKEMASE
ncbi:major facilitator superfamily domain-containing protein [Rhypophila decipiens]|uniref:Major facilitator superfamily domain-containing protein n=1 Tax=Rhypophila decipiens TaxID=261697 RepID=A0AAN6Y1K6_9PEZI|nr:major facilitator superfamily domain-containing protein [Rhypophila decipiens]